MNTDNLWVGFCGVCVICFTIIIMLIIGAHNERVQKYVEAGYTQSMVIGYSEPIWIKN